jgi:hypothetical protein
MAGVRQREARSVQANSRAMQAVKMRVVFIAFSFFIGY